MPRRRDGLAQGPNLDREIPQGRGLLAADQNREAAGLTREVAQQTIPDPTPEQTNPRDGLTGGLLQARAARGIGCRQGLGDAAEQGAIVSTSQAPGGGMAAQTIQHPIARHRRRQEVGMVDVDGSGRQGQGTFGGRGR